MTYTLRELSLPELALRLDASQGDTVYLVYIVPANEIADVANELCGELEDAGVRTTQVDSTSATRLLHDLGSLEDTLVINAGCYRAADWSLLDRRRSALRRITACLRF